MMKVKLPKGESLWYYLMRGRTIQERGGFRKDVDVKEIKSVRKVNGLCYRPTWIDQSTYESTLATSEQLEANIEWASKVALAIRTYSSTGSFAFVPELCEKVGIDCYIGAWLGGDGGRNRKEIDDIIRVGDLAPACFKRMKALIVGSEVLKRSEMAEEGLIRYVGEVKKSVTLPVSVAETWRIWLDHPKLAQEVDFLTVHVHPYREGRPVDTAAGNVVRVWKVLKGIFPGKRIIIGETGWPSKGETIEKAIPSEENQARFFMEFAVLAEKEGIEYFYLKLLPILKAKAHASKSAQQVMQRFKELCEKESLIRTRRSIRRARRTPPAQP